MIDSDDAATPSNTTASSTPRYIWDWTYSPNSDSVPICRVHSSASIECLLPASVHFPIKLYHLHANILSMNWFYDTID
eukprot:jgi/Psemu1/36616/gm1.36616_g